MDWHVGPWLLALGLISGCTSDVGGSGGGIPGDSASDGATSDGATSDGATSGGATSGGATSGGATSSGAVDGGSAGSTSQLCEDGGDGWSGDQNTGSGDGSGSTGGGPIGMDDDMPLVAMIPDLQQGVVPRGTWVQLEGVVVTTPPAQTETGLGFEVFVQDPGGGAWSGLRIRMEAEAEALPMGEAVDVVGTLLAQDDYYLLELDEDGMTGLGPGVLPDPVVVSVDDLALGDADGRPYEGIAVVVEQVTVTDDDPCDGEFIIEDIARVDDRFAPGEIAAPSTGTTLTSVQGVLVYAQDAFELAPTDPGGIV